MPRPRRLSFPEILEQARIAVARSALITVAEFRTMLGGGTLSELGGALRAAKMETGALPGAREAIPTALRDLVRRPGQDEAPDAGQPLEARLDALLGPASQLLATAQESLAQARTGLFSVISSAIERANEHAAQQALEAWRAVQELTEASSALERERDETAAILLATHAEHGEERSSLREQLLAHRQQLELQQERRRVAAGILSDLHQTHVQLTTDLSKSQEETHLLMRRAAAAEQRAAVAEARLEQLAHTERQLRETTAAFHAANAALGASTTDVATLRATVATLERECAILRTSTEHARTVATQATALAESQERELKRLRVGPQGRGT